jgi:hypothetical protein
MENQVLLDHGEQTGDLLGFVAAVTRGLLDQFVSLGAWRDVLPRDLHGEGGIRTPDGLKAHTGFRDRRKQAESPVSTVVSVWGERIRERRAILK